MILKLLINKEEKTFSTPFVSGMVFRKYIELKESITDMASLKSKELDEMAGLVVFAFDNQFTLEEFYNGIPHDQVEITIANLFAPTPKKGKVGEENGKKF
jgi:hypothetical protein